MIKLRAGKVDKYALVKAVIYLVLALTFFYADFAIASAPSGLSAVISNVQGTFKTFAKFITGAAFLVGLGFALGAVLKFKAHKDNPTQIPIGTPIALLFIAVALLFLPYLFGRVGMTVFGSSKGTGVSGVSGIT